MPGNTIFNVRADASARTSTLTTPKWGGLASFLLAVAFVVPSLIYFSGNLRGNLSARTISVRYPGASPR
jgi:hypothetical protein